MTRYLNLVIVLLRSKRNLRPAAGVAFVLVVRSLFVEGFTPMKFRPLALFALAAGFAVLVGDFTALDAQEKALKKGKKKFDPVVPAKPADPVAKPEVKPVPQPEPTLATPTDKDAVALAKVIDAEINRQLAASKLVASAACSDDEFLRRAYLDIIGVIPTAEQAKAFLDDKSTDKRAKLLDELLADPRLRPAHGRHLDREALPEGLRQPLRPERPALQVVRGGVQQERAAGTSS